MSYSVRPHRRPPTRLPRPWDSPGKNTGVGCHFLLQCMKVKSESEVAQSCPTLSDLMDCSLPDSSIHGIFQARVLEWGAIAFSQANAKMHYFRISTLILRMTFHLILSLVKKKYMVKKYIYRLKTHLNLYLIKVLYTSFSRKCKFNKKMRLVISSKRSWQTIIMHSCK